MWRSLRRLRRLRLMARRHRTFLNVTRLAMIFLAAFGGAYGFIAGSRSPHSGYDPHAFAIGVSFLWALSCVALAALTLRNRLLKRATRTLALQHETLAKRNRELQQCVDRARALFDSQSDLIIIRDPNGRIVEANEAFTAATGHARDALIGREFTLPVIAQGDVTLDANGTRSFDQEIETAHGRRWIAWRETRVHGENGPAQWQCVGRDITDRAAAVRQLETARAQADAASRAKSRFLAMASHEIRAPLNGIVGMSGLLLGTPLGADQKTYVRAVKASGDALLTLIEELLDDTRIESGSAKRDDENFALGAMVESVAGLLAPRAEATGIEIAADVDERLPARIVGDAVRLRQVLLDLTGTALNFAAGSGVSISATPEGEDIAFVVRAFGHDTASEEPPRSVGDGGKGDEAIAQPDAGTSFGFEISERIVLQMGGSLRAERAMGEGASYTVRLPLKPVQGPHDGAGFEAPDLAGRDVLIVMRRPIEASFVEARLSRWGAQVSVTADPDVARALLPERDWHAILIDHADAPSRALAELARHHSGKCIVLLTAADHAARDGDLPPGFTEFLLKPLRAASLAARLRGDPDIAVTSPIPTGQEGDVSADQWPAGQGLSVLVAEDNEINALLVRALLTRLGYQYVVVADGAEAIDAWQLARRSGMPYDLILMDAQMPVLDGFAAVHRIRAMEAAESAPRTPIHVLAANASDAERALCADAMMDGILIKPLDGDKLEAAIAGLAPAQSVAA